MAKATIKQLDRVIRNDAKRIVQQKKRRFDADQKISVTNKRVAQAERETLDITSFDNSQHAKNARRKVWDLRKVQSAQAEVVRASLIDIDASKRRIRNRIDDLDRTETVVLRQQIHERENIERANRQMADAPLNIRVERNAKNQIAASREILARVEKDKSDLANARLFVRQSGKTIFGR